MWERVRRDHRAGGSLGPLSKTRGLSPFSSFLGDMTMVRGALALLLVLCSAGPAAALIAGTQCRAVPSLVARPSARCCAAEQAVVEEAPEPCDFPGCDGSGRALGGLAAIPLFSWWPIKVHPSPCTRRTPAPALARLRMPALARSAPQQLAASALLLPLALAGAAGSLCCGCGCYGGC